MIKLIEQCPNYETEGLCPHRLRTTEYVPKEVNLVARLNKRLFPGYSHGRRHLVYTDKSTSEK